MSKDLVVRREVQGLFPKWESSVARRSRLLKRADPDGVGHRHWGWDSKHTIFRGGPPSQVYLLARTPGPPLWWEESLQFFSLKSRHHYYLPTTLSQPPTPNTHTQNRISGSTSLPGFSVPGGHTGYPHPPSSQPCNLPTLLTRYPGSPT